ncbi:hypothetical protein [Paenibacillus lacisoli]|nr:hypothetical protein [Paenibacillus sp. JX-17]
MIYDLTNDGTSEIIILAWNARMGEDSRGYIGIYSKTGKLIAVQKYENYEFIPFQLHQLKNKTHKNCLALDNLPGGSGGSNMVILALRNNKLITLAQIDSSEGTRVIKDSDKDGNDEIYGYEWYLAEETRNVAHSVAIYDKYMYKWDSVNKKYLKYVYGQDGKRDDLRPHIGKLSLTEAVNLVNNASKKIYKTPSISFTSYKNNMQYLLTYNLIYEKYSESLVDTNSIYLPELEKNTSQLSFSSDGNKATLHGKIKYEDYDTGESGVMNTYIIFLKTKYGWKIDNTSYKI